MSKLFLITDEVPQDYTQHIPLVLQHWERPFRAVCKQLSTEARLAGYTSANGYNLVVHWAFYAFEQYQIVIEYDNIGSALRIFFPDEQAELMMLLKANFG